MLQPEQLKRVGEIFAPEVEELRAFFMSAGIQTGNAKALPNVAARVATDRAFQRDLCCHVWVILSARKSEMSYAELLGVVALAAAGPAFATAATDRDAHDLLRFLMEARHDLENRPVRTPDAPGPAVLPYPSQLPGKPSRTEATKSGQQIAWEKPTRRRKTVLTLSVICAAAVIVAAVWLREHTPSIPASASPTIARQISNERGPENNPTSPLSEPATEMPRAVHLLKDMGSRHSLSRRAAAVTAEMPRLHDILPVHPEASNATKSIQSLVSLSTGNSTTRQADTGESVSRADTHSINDVRGTSIPSATPSAELSRQLGARTLSPDYALEDRSYNARYPRLLRRRPLLPTADNRSDAVEQVASNEQPALFRGSANAAVATTVRPVSLGVMAANILYSPAPAYPPAAAAAHVQGEVKVQAEVDRDGNVAFARVISGPALLRDAAVDAVQRWRYRPYVSAGRPVAMSATAVLDFQLQ